MEKYRSFSLRVATIACALGLMLPVTPASLSGVEHAGVKAVYAEPASPGFLASAPGKPAPSPRMVDEILEGIAEPSFEDSKFSDSGGKNISAIICACACQCDCSACVACPACAACHCRCACACTSCGACHCFCSCDCASCGACGSCGACNCDCACACACACACCGGKFLCHDDQQLQ